MILAIASVVTFLKKKLVRVKKETIDRPWILACIISLLIVLWMASGSVDAVSVKKNNKENKKTLVSKVQIEHFRAERVARTLSLYGNTKADKQIEIKAEVSGKVKRTLAKRGSFVKKGQVILELELNDLKNRLDSAKALVNQRDFEYQAVKALTDKGYQNSTRLSSAKADLVQAKTQVASLDISIKNTLIKAPFDGVLNQRFVEIGDYVQHGGRIASLVDLDPIIVQVDISEMNISDISLEQEANARFVNGDVVTGLVRYISSVANHQTNTFEAEVAFPNPSFSRLSGASAELELKLEDTMAMKLSPSVLALNEGGSLGVKHVKNGHVIFSKVDIFKNEVDGVWLTGLGSEADIIVLGQGFVRHGDPVQTRYPLPVPISEFIVTD